MTTKQMLCVDCWEVVELKSKNLVAFGDDDTIEFVCHKKCNDGNEDTGTLISLDDPKEIIRWAKDKVEFNKNISHDLGQELDFLRNVFGFKYVYELQRFIMERKKLKHQHKKYRMLPVSPKRK